MNLLPETLNARWAMCVAFALALPSTPTFAGDVSDAVVTKIAISKALGEMLLIAVDKPKSGTPACQTNTAWALRPAVDNGTG